MKRWGRGVVGVLLGVVGSKQAREKMVWFHTMRWSKGGTRTGLGGKGVEAGPSVNGEQKMDQKHKPHAVRSQEQNSFHYPND